MVKKTIILLIIGLLFGTTAVWAESRPSIVTVEGKQLMVQRRLPDGILGPKKPYIIKGFSWQPAGAAPAEGPNPLYPADPSKNVDYGFFFDWPNRYPQGHEILGYWMKNEAMEHRVDDARLLKELNANTVRVYTDFGVDPQVYNAILDELYNNGIMVVMTVAKSKEDFLSTFYVFKDTESLDNHFIPSGYMGDYLDLQQEYVPGNAVAGADCIKINYSAAKSRNQGWAGIYWQNPANNWGEDPNGRYDLRGARKVSFWAKGENGGEVVDAFKIGGIGGSYPDSDSAQIGPVTLSNKWQKFEIYLSGKDLSGISGGFCVTFASANGGSIIYLDDIRYEGQDIPIGKKPYYTEIVSLYKDHPAILMWLLGNEWNLNNYYESYAHTQSEFNFAVADTEKAASEIHKIDPNHPVSSSLGDVFGPSDCDPTNPCCDPNFDLWEISEILPLCPSVDIWGINSYRGASFYDRQGRNLFEQWRLISNKPMYLSEFGTDSFKTTNYSMLYPDCRIQTYNPTGSIDENLQVSTDLGLWNEIKPNLSANNPVYGICAGGLVHEFSDEVWKDGNFNAGLGWPSTYYPTDNHSYDQYNTGGFAFNGHPDGVANEEYFGIVNANRQPKQIFNYLKSFYRDLDLPKTPSGLKVESVTYNSVTLSWRDNSFNETGFIIERPVLGTRSWFILTTVGENVTSYTDRNLNPGTSYTYRVRAINDSGSSVASNMVTIVTPRVTTGGPADPSNLSATVYKTGLYGNGRLVKLSWKDNAITEEYYAVWCTETNSGNLRLPPNTTTYSNGLEPGKIYHFCVWAGNKAGISNKIYIEVRT